MSPLSVSMLAKMDRDRAIIQLESRLIFRMNELTLVEIQPQKQAADKPTLDVARGAGGARGGADAFPKTVALLESIMKAKGLPVSAPTGR